MKTNTIKELSIQIHLNGLSFCILNKTTNTVEFLTSTVFETKLNPEDVLNRLKTELSLYSEFSEDFDAVLIIHQNELSTLVPKALYDPEIKADYLKFNTKILKTDFIASDDIVINESINLYVPYVNINNYIFDTFGAFEYKHSSSLLLSAILKDHDVSQGITVYINVNKASLELMVVSQGELQLYNVFEYYSKDDFIYYILFVFEQLQLDTESVPIKLSGVIAKNDELYTILYTYVRFIDFMTPDFDFKISETIDNQMLHQHYLILNSF